MILYHGSNSLIEKVELQRCKPFKDFGRGFYCITIKRQAELMAKRVAAIFDGTVKGMEYRRLTDQYSFHSDNSLRYLISSGGI